MNQDKPDLRAPRRTRIAVIALVAVLHIAAVLVLVRAFAPDLARVAVDRVVATFTVTITAPPPPALAASPQAGAAAEPGRRAPARADSAPRPRQDLAKANAPPAAGSGSAVSAGAAASGGGTGAGGQGEGTGSGGGGQGSGGGLARRAEKIGGDISSARDFPRETRDLRIDDYAVVAIAVGADGRPTGCRVVRAARDPEAGAITCKLALQRFRFRPATDVQGNPVASTYGWQQRWHY